MPRVGNDAFQTWFKTTLKLSGLFRVTHHKDPVPHLLFESWGFHHMPYESFYTNDYNKFEGCDFEGEDESCSNQYSLDANVLNHLNYLDFDFTRNWISCEI
jgi:hypothetical protein